MKYKEDWSKIEIKTYKLIQMEYTHYTKTLLKTFPLKKKYCIASSLLLLYKTTIIHNISYQVITF